VATIFITIQTGMVARDLLECGPVERVLGHPDARVVLLTPGARDPAFVADVAGDRVCVVPQVPYAPSTLVWRIMTRRWRHARSPRVADLFHRLEERFIPSEPSYDALLREHAPALVVSGDPLRPGDANLIAQAHRHGVPTLGSVRSWDNILKHLRTRPDALTVWNARNAREATEVDLYRPAAVTQVGAPQLDVYFHPEEWMTSREALCASEGLDPTKKILLLATSSFTYESDQTFLVDMVLDAIGSGAIRQPLQVVVRLHPDDRVGRYLKYRHVPGVTLDVPERYLATLGWTMTRADLGRMANLLHHADLMVNFATTVTLESAITDTPTLLVAFSPIDPQEMERYVVGLHFKMHYRPIVERDLAPVAWDRDALVAWINRYLDDPCLYKAQRAELVREWVQFTDGRSGERLGDAILRHAGLGTPKGRRASGGAPRDGRGEGRAPSPSGRGSG
jgi:hypothetical protein